MCYPVCAYVNIGHKFSGIIPREHSNVDFTPLPRGPTYNLRFTITVSPHLILSGVTYFYWATFPNLITSTTTVYVDSPRICCITPPNLHSCSIHRHKPNSMYQSSIEVTLLRVKKSIHETASRDQDQDQVLCISPTFVDWKVGSMIDKHLATISCPYNPEG